jgi:hypothetical protein
MLLLSLYIASHAIYFFSTNNAQRISLKTNHSTFAHSTPYIERFKKINILGVQKKSAQKQPKHQLVHIFVLIIIIEGKL